MSAQITGIKGTSNNSGNSGSSNVGDTISVTGVVEWTWERQGIDLGVGADNRKGIQSRTNDDQDRERLTKVPKGGMHNWQQHRGHHGERKQSKRCNSKSEVFGGIQWTIFFGGRSLRLSSPTKCNRDYRNNNIHQYNKQKKKKKINLIFAADNRQGIQSNFLQRNKCKDLNE